MPPLTASLWLLLLLCGRLASADQRSIDAEPGQNITLPCRAAGNGTIRLIEWIRTDLGSENVLLYRDDQIDPDAQHPSFRNRVDLADRRSEDGDASMVLKNTEKDDSGIYQCNVAHEVNKKLISTIILTVKDPFPSWASALLALLALLVLVLIVAAGLLYRFRRYFTPVPPAEVPLGAESVKLLCKVPPWRIRDAAEVVWKDEADRTVHVYPNGPDQPGQQDGFYGTRTSMNKNPLRAGDLSLTLRRPTGGDRGDFTCSVYNRKRDVLVTKQVCLHVKVQRVEAESGAESVLLPCRTRVQLPEGATVEWRDDVDRTVHVYQNGSDQPGQQDGFYGTRTRMNKNPLRAGDLSLTLTGPRKGDSSRYTCSVSSRKGDILMKTQVDLEVKVPQVEAESGAESVRLPWRTTAQLLKGAARLEWRDRSDRRVHVYQNGSDQPGDQNQDYRTRTSMDEDPLSTGDLSLTLTWPTERDGQIYTCRVYSRDGDVLREKRVRLHVKVPQVEAESGAESVLLPCRTTAQLTGDARVEWSDSRGRTVHVHQSGSDQPGEQDQDYRTRTRMNVYPLRTGDLSLTLRRPTGGDKGIYTCTISTRGILMKKQVDLEVKVPQVEVEEAESGVESVQLPCRTTVQLPGGVRVEWMSDKYRKVHVYQNGSDQPAEQHQLYRTRTSMDSDLLRNGDFSLTLRRPTEEDSSRYTCSVYGDGDILIKKHVDLQVKVPQVEAESGAESVLLPCMTSVQLPENARVEWRDSGDRTVHVRQNGSDQSGDQDQIYRTRTRMDEDLRLTLRRPTEEDRGIYTCSVSSREGNILMKKQVRLWVKDQQVEVEEGAAAAVQNIS